METHLKEAIAAAVLTISPLQPSADIPAPRPYPEPESSHVTQVIDSENNYPITLQGEKELNPVGTVKFQEIGPFYPNGELKQLPSDGARSLWVRPENPDVIYAGEWGHIGNGIEKSTDGGKTWKTTISKASYRFYGGIPRDFFQYKEQVFAVSDYALITERVDGTWDSHKIDLPVLQTGAVLEDGTILVGGMGGIQLMYDFGFDNDEVHGNNLHSEKAEGLPENIFVRSIEVDEKEDRIYVGGWMDYKGINGQSMDKGGSGLWVSDDKGKTFKRHEQADSLVNNKNQDPTINSIKVTYYNGNRIIIIGGEGRGPLTDRKPSPDVPSLWISVNGSPFSEGLANFAGWAKENGNDLVNPQRGITETDDYIIISSYANSIVACRKQDILDAQMGQGPIVWHKISPEGFASGATITLKDQNDKFQLFSGGNSWKSAIPPFTPTSLVADLETQLDAIFRPK